MVDIADAITDPAGSMSSVLDGWAEGYDAVLVHLDIDLVNFLELPLSEEITRVGGIAAGRRRRRRHGAPPWQSCRTDRDRGQPDHDPDGRAIWDLVATVTTVLAATIH